MPKPESCIGLRRVAHYLALHLGYITTFPLVAIIRGFGVVFGSAPFGFGSASFGQRPDEAAICGGCTGLDLKQTLALNSFENMVGMCLALNRNPNPHHLGNRSQ